TIVVMWLPVADADRCAADGCIGSHPPLNGGGVDKWFEARTGLTISLDGVVEFICVEVVPTNHRHNLTVLCVESHHRSLYSGNLRKLNFQSTILLIDFLNLKLAKVTVLEFILRLTMTPTHIGHGK